MGKMRRRDFLSVGMAPALCLGIAAPTARREVSRAASLLAAEPRIIVHSPDSMRIYLRSPGICRLDSGRLVFTMEYSQAGKKKVPGMQKTEDGKAYRGRVFVSDDGGHTVRETGAFPLCQARPFVAGKFLYILGHYDDLGVVCSEDNGETWSEVSWLTTNQQWHQAPCNVHFDRDRVYLVMERHTVPNLKIWPVFSIAPVVLSAPVNADLTKRDSWTFSNELTYQACVKQVGGISGLGVPFYSLGPTVKGKAGGMKPRPMAPAGWLETNLVVFRDPDHLWYDPTGRTFYLWMRAHTGTTNFACIAKAVEGPDGAITVQPATAPSGKPVLYVPCPGGHLKFHILYDAVTRLYWLASNQPTDSMTRPDRLPETRYGLPDNERHRLALHFSRNCVDWCFAGLVDKTDDPRQSRNYPSMAFDGDDLLVFARSGSPEAVNAHDGDILTLHRVREFRALVY